MKCVHSPIYETLKFDPVFLIAAATSLHNICHTTISNSY
jgi:hypothetical protein